jgi:hypothetical protein
MCSRDSALHSSWACWYIPIQRLVKYQAGSNVSHSRSSVNGQQVQGVMVVQNGTVQTYTCLSPQQYVTVDQSSSGWACFEETTGVWLLHSQPPQTAYSYQQPQVYGTTPAVPVYSYPYTYPYGYYPYDGYYPYYSYSPFFIGPRFGFGFGFGSRIFVNRSVVIGRPIGINRPIGISRPVGIGRPVGTFAASRPPSGFRSAGGGRAFGRAGRR